MIDRGITNAINNIVVSPASRDQLGNVSAPFGVSINSFKAGIQTLTKFETKCLLIQLAEIESNNNANLITLGVPQIGTYRANINANSVVSHWGTYYANVATVTITNADHANIKLGMVANVQSPSQGSFGSNTMVIQKSVGGNITAGNFIPGCTYIITSLGTTDFITVGANASVIGNVFVANAAGSGTGTALGTNNEIILGSNHTVSGDIIFNVNPLCLGKYQNSQFLLTQQGYLDNAGNWTGKDGVDTNEVFLSATEIQNNIMRDYIQDQYVELIRVGAIKENDSKETIAGMLAVVYQYHDITNPQLNYKVFDTQGIITVENYSAASRANVWRATGQTVDSRGRPGHIYFNGGRYAIRSLGADVPE